MTPNEANTILRNKVEEFIIQRNAVNNHDKIMALVEAYLKDCAANSHYDQVANINALIGIYDRGDVMGFLSAIQHKDTLCHINSDKDMFRGLSK